MKTLTILTRASRPESGGSAQVTTPFAYDLRAKPDRCPECGTAKAQTAA